MSCDNCKFQDETLIGQPDDDIETILAELAQKNAHEEKLKQLERSADGVVATLDEREKTHGDFKDNGHLSQVLKTEIRQGKNYNALTYPQREALDLIATKISRIVNGDPRHSDSWHDIAGYAKLGESETD